MSPLRLRRDDTALLVIDVQQKLAAAMSPPLLERMLRRTRALVEGAQALGLPIAFTEQYPKGLGPTVPVLREGLVGIQPVEKLRFSAVDDRLKARLAGRHHVLVAGMETHVCVFQTARELARRGYVTHVVADAVASRTEENRAAGLSLCERAGAVVTVTEALVFDWLRAAGTEAFKHISKLVR